MAKMLRSRHTGVLFGYNEKLAETHAADYEVVEVPESVIKKPRKKRTPKPKPPVQEGLFDGMDDK